MRERDELIALKRDKDVKERERKNMCTEKKRKEKKRKRKKRKEKRRKEE
jgi:hypothetical protein